MAFADETRVTEISIAADGRIYVFGASRQVIELLSDLQLGDPSLDRRAQHAGVQWSLGTSGKGDRLPKPDGTHGDD